MSDRGFLMHGRVSGSHSREKVDDNSLLWSQFFVRYTRATRRGGRILFFYVPGETGLFSGAAKFRRRTAGKNPCQGPVSRARALMAPDVKGIKQRRPHSPTSSLLPKPIYLELASFVESVALDVISSFSTMATFSICTQDFWQ